MDESTLADIEYAKTLQLALKDAISQNEKLSEEDMHKLENLIDNVHGVEHYDYALLGIIQEESERYFNGDISLNDAVDIIQNRAFVYINE